MNDFFNTNTPDTVNVNGNSLTALDVAKIALLGNTRVHWNGADTYVSTARISNELARFFLDDKQEQEKLADKLFRASTWGYSSKNEAFDEQTAKVLTEAQNIGIDWATSRLYTCLTKNEDGTRFINVDKLEATLDVKLGDSVRERLTLVTAKKDVDGDWVFDSATGRSYKDNATVGILEAVGEAVNMVDIVTKEALHFVRRGITNFEEIANESYALDIDRMTAGDIADVKQAIVESGVTPEEYTVFFSQAYNECAMAVSEGIEERWDFTEGCEVKTFATHGEADEFRRAFNDAFSVQKKRTKLATQLEETTKYLEEIKKKLEALNS
jgi:hypothetical protein